jgi:hypothetical protein
MTNTINLPVLVLSLPCTLPLSLSSMIPRVRGQSFKSGGIGGMLKSGPDVRCFRGRPVQPITATSEVVPGAAAEKVTFVSSLVHCELACWLVSALLTDAPQLAN